MKVMVVSVVVFFGTIIYFCATHPPYLYVRDVKGGGYALFEYRPADWDKCLTRAITRDRAEALRRDLLEAGYLERKP